MIILITELVDYTGIVGSSEELMDNVVCTTTIHPRKGW